MQTTIRDMDERYIAAVDLGTSKIALSVAKVEGNDVQIIYYDEEPSDGIRYSYVFNPLKVSGPLKRSIEKAEKELGIKILQAVVGAVGAYLLVWKCGLKKLWHRSFGE